MTEHVFIVGVEIESPADRRGAQAELYQRLGKVTGDGLAWWHAEDDRTDNSDRDSAVFVPNGSSLPTLLGMLPESTRATIRAALEDAMDYRLPEEGVDCADCDPHGMPCLDHDMDHQRHTEYDDLLGDLLGHTDVVIAE